MMSRPLLLILLASLLAGCGSRPSSATSLAGVRTLTLASVSAVSAAELSPGLDRDLESALRRSLSVRGYQLQDAEGGDAVVRASWYQESRLQASGRREVHLGISISVFDRSGARVFSVRSSRTTPAGQWNGDRVAAEVANLLRGLPESGAR
jgi:hypothetical protein